jgi:outer membrane protein TolC
MSPILPAMLFDRNPQMNSDIGGKEGVRPGAGKPRRAFAFGATVAACAFLAGCTGEFYRKSADNEVYKILAQKRKRALNEEAPFTIQQPYGDPLAGLPRRRQFLIPPKEGDPAWSDPSNVLTIISLRKALEIGIQNSRAYQTQKETVYLAALGLTLQRHLWSPTFTSLMSGSAQSANGEETWVGDTQFGATELLATGADLTLNLSTSFLRYITGNNPMPQAQSTLTGTLLQPLWQGAGQEIAQENLTLAERGVIYAVRTFARYHRTFVVSIATGYYSVLEQRQVVRNEWENYQTLIEEHKETEMLAQAGRLPEFQVDEARQGELSAHDSWNQAEEQYKLLLDQLKYLLSLPTDSAVDVDDAELNALSEQGIIDPKLSEEAAVRQALALRLDLMNARDAVADAALEVHVAKNGLAPLVDLVFSGTAVSVQPARPGQFNLMQGTYSAGLNVGLPLDATAGRNTLRSSLIALDQAERAVADLTDNIKLQVRSDWITMQEAKQSYEIQRKSAELAQRRVKITMLLLLQAGRVTTLDLLDAQTAWHTAENALVTALVNHTNARLALWRDIETLSMDPAGHIEEKAVHGQSANE